MVQVWMKLAILSLSPSEWFLRSFHFYCLGDVEKHSRSLGGRGCLGPCCHSLEELASVCISGVVVRSAVPEECMKPALLGVLLG